MNELLQKHGCSNVFSIPDGLKEIMSDISREVLREQPAKIFDFISNYLSALIITREHGVMAVKILDDLCDCRPTVLQHLKELGFEKAQAENLAEIIKEEIEQFNPVDGKDKIKEIQIMKRILTKIHLDEEMTAHVCQISRNAYRDYWYRKNILQKKLKTHPDEPWEIAAEHTLEIYKRTRPSFDELNRAAIKIQAAYKGYHLRRNLLAHLIPKPKKKGPKMNLPGPPIDAASSRQIEFGPVINVRVREDDVHAMFGDNDTEKRGLSYEPRETITYVTPPEVLEVASSADKQTQEEYQVPTFRRFAGISPNPSASEVLEAGDRDTSKAVNMQIPRQSQLSTQIASEERTAEEAMNDYNEEDMIEDMSIKESMATGHTDERINDEDETVKTVSEATGEVTEGMESVYEVSEDEVEEMENDLGFD